MKTLLVDLKGFGISFADIQPYPGTSIDPDRLAPLNNKVFDHLDTNFYGQSLASFMPSDTRPAGWVSSSNWTPKHWTFGAIDPTGLIDTVKSWGGKDTDDPDHLDCEWFVLRAAYIDMPTVISAKTLAAVEADPARWAVLHVA